VQVELSSRAESDDDSGEWEKTGPDGRFVIENVSPGPYVITAGARTDLDGKVLVSFESGSMEITVAGSIDFDPRRGLLDSMRKDDAERRMARGSASAELHVSGGATTDLVLNLEPPRAVSGRVIVDGMTAPPKLGAIELVLTEVGGSSGSMMIKITDDGTFAKPQVAPGRYAVNVMGESAPWTIASAVSGGTDALDFLLTVPRDRDVRDLVVTLRDRASELSGMVTDGSNQRASNRSVIVFPADERLWVTATDRIKVTGLDADGRFTFSLRPGAYRLALVESLEPDEWLDAKLLRELSVASTPVNIGAGERKVQDLRVR
jgi:hypothetical protein